MFIYELIGVLVCLPLFASRDKKTKLKIKKHILSVQDVCVIVLVLVLFFVSSFRYGIGTDYNIYVDKFEKFEFSSSEWLNVALVWVIKSLGGGFHLFLVLTEVLVFSLLGYTIIKFVPDENKLWSLIIFVLFNMFGASLNYIRQFPAIVLSLMSMYWLSRANRKNKKYFLYSLIYLALAVGFHTSCLFVVPFCLIAKIGVINRKSVLAITVIFTLLWFINPIEYINKITLWIMNNLTGRWASGTIDTADSSWAARLYNSGAARIDRLLYFPFMIIMTQMLRDEKYQLSLVNKFIIKLFYIYNLLIALNVGSEMIDRVLLYVSIVQIFAIPAMFSYVKYRYGEVWSFLFKCCILAIGVFVLLRELNANVHEIVPYVSIFGNLW